jgi:hypothetical protein
MDFPFGFSRWKFLSLNLPNFNKSHINSLTIYEDISEQTFSEHEEHISMVLKKISPRTIFNLKNEGQKIDKRIHFLLPLVFCPIERFTICFEERLFPQEKTKVYFPSCAKEIELEFIGPKSCVGISLENIDKVSLLSQTLIISFYCCSLQNIDGCELRSILMHFNKIKKIRVLVIECGAEFIDYVTSTCNEFKTLPIEIQ